VAEQLGFGAAFAWRHPHEIFSEHAALSGLKMTASGRSISAGWRISAVRRGTTWRRFAGRSAAAAPLSIYSGLARRWQIAHGAGDAPGHARRDRRLYPLILNSGRIRDQWHTMTRTGSVPRLMQHIAEPVVEVAPADARRLQLREGELARIWSRNGVMVAKTVVSRGQRPARCLCRCTGIISLPAGEGSTTCCRR
jgi:assimilatory nitrate reductase catalytic subunit